MDLALLKIRHGPSYATPEGVAADKLVDVLAASGRRARSCLVDRQDALARHATGAADAVLATSDAQAAALAARHAASGRFGFVWCQLRELDHFYFGRSKHARRAQQLQQRRALRDGVPGAGGGEGGAAAAEEEEAELRREAAEVEAEAAQFSPAALRQQLQRLDGAVGALLSGLPPNALLVVATGQGDMAECRRQQEIKIRRQQQLDGLPPWSAADERAHGDTLEREMTGLCFCAVKGAAGGGGGGGGGSGEGGGRRRQRGLECGDEGHRQEGQPDEGDEGDEDGVEEASDDEEGRQEDSDE